MTGEESVNALRCCASVDGTGCAKCSNEELNNDELLPCADVLKSVAADLIENQQNHIAALREEIERARMLSDIQRCTTCDYWQESDPRCMCGCSQYGGKTVSRDNYCGNWTRHIDWLAVTERLPEPTVCVLVAYSNGAVEVDAWGHDGWMGEDLSNGTITHWMQLPSAPVEVQNA